MNITKWRGRAGRRGIDTIGYVYAQIVPAYADPKEIRGVVADKIEPIESQFNLSIPVFSICIRSMAMTFTMFIR